MESINSDVKELFSLVSGPGFDKAFEAETKNHNTYLDAYESLEKRYEQAYGVRKYPSYDAYRKARQRRISNYRQAG